MERRERRRVDDRGGRRPDVGDQPGRIVVARLGDLHLVDTVRTYAVEERSARLGA